VAEPEAGPGLGNEDAVAGVARVVPDLDGLIEAEAADAVGEAGDVLRAVIGDPCEAVVVEEDVRGGGDAVFAVERAGVDEIAVRDASGESDVFAATALEFFRGGAARADQPPDCDEEEDNADTEGGDDAGVIALKQLPEVVDALVHGDGQG